VITVVIALLATYGGLCAWTAILDLWRRQFRGSFWCEHCKRWRSLES